MKHWRYIALHAATASAFIFLLQRYALSASLDRSKLPVLRREPMLDFGSRRVGEGLG
jgi:hypothetical protein